MMVHSALLCDGSGDWSCGTRPRSGIREMRASMQGRWGGPPSRYIPHGLPPSSATLSDVSAMATADRVGPVQVSPYLFISRCWTPGSDRPIPNAPTASAITKEIASNRGKAARPSGALASSHPTMPCIIPSGTNARTRTATTNAKAEMTKMETERLRPGPARRR